MKKCLLSKTHTLSIKLTCAQIWKNKIYFPPLERCTDNGAMVAFAGSFYLSNNNQAKNDLVRPKWPLSEL